MDLVVRQGEVEDAEQCAAIFYEAFRSIAEEHNFPTDVSPPDGETVSNWQKRFANPAYYVVVAERGGRIVGSNILDERGSIAGVGPITVDPSFQHAGAGRKLMEAVLHRASEKSFMGVRLIQAAYNRRSLVLYSKLGFEVREFLVTFQGSPLQLEISGCEVRPAERKDIPLCNQLCQTIHGHHRGGALRDAIEQGTAVVVERGDRITGYATVIGYSGHAVGESNIDLKALIGAAPEFVGPAGFLLPTRNGELLRWCLQNGLRVIQPMSLMTLGFYKEPSGPFLPSIYY
jgi:L-amino acid N-acyltransferase YncA